MVGPCHQNDFWDQPVWRQPLGGHCWNTIQQRSRKDRSIHAPIMQHNLSDTTGSYQGNYANNTTNTSAFDVFDLFDGPEIDNPDVATPTQDHSSSSFVRTPGYNLLLLGLILLGVGVWINIAVQTYVACRKRKRQRAISPSPTDVVIGDMGEPNGQVPPRISHQRLRNNEDEESRAAEVETGR